MSASGRAARRAFVALAWTLVAVQARADEAADIATARTLGIEGVRLADAGNCADAIDRLVRAERLHHAPTTATRLGECEIETGKLVRGTERLRHVLREPLGAAPPAAFLAAVTRAEKALQGAQGRIPTLALSVRSPAGVPLTVRIDDETVSDATLGAPRPIDPGSHTIDVGGPELRPKRTSISLAEGESRAITLDVEPAPSRVDAPTSRQAPPVHAEPGSSRRSLAPSAVLFGAAALGLGVGLYSGLRVAETRSMLETRCDERSVCPSDAEAELERAKTWATISTVGFATAGVGLAAGIVLLVTGGGASAAKRAAVRPRLGLLSAGMEGNF